MDTAPEILKQKIFCTCCKNINTIMVKSQNKTEKKLIINMNPVSRTIVRSAPEQLKEKT